jgi:DNA-binding response OmpR family regulator
MLSTRKPSPASLASPVVVPSETATRIVLDGARNKFREQGNAGNDGRVYVSKARKALNCRGDVLPIGPLVFITERESSAGRIALENLGREGFSVRMFSMTTDMIQRAAQLYPSVIIIESTMSRKGALEICRGIRGIQSLARTPVILLAANASDEERVLGLESGADDYILESSSGREIVALVHAVMRRFARQKLHSGATHLSPPFLHSVVGTLSPTIRRGDIEIDTTSMRISVRGNEIVTTNLEFRLLYYLVHNQARVFTRDQLLDAVWGTQYVELRSVDACVRRLRRKIEPDPLRPTYLKTIRGAGYTLHVAAA